MITPPRVQRHRQTDAARRRVRTQGNRVSRPPQRRAPKARKPSYEKSGALAGLSVMFSCFAFMTGSMFWAIGAVTTTAASGYVARKTYKRELAQVKATGQPIGAKPKAGDPIPPGVKPTELDPPAARKPQPRATRKPGSHHAAKCKANPPGGPTCRCPDGPNRKGAAKTTTKRASTGARRQQ